MTLIFDDIEIEWLGYATVRISGPEQTIYLDPGRYGVLTGEWTADSPGAAEAHPPGRDYRPEDGDHVCGSHIHHYDPGGIDRGASDDATVVVCEGINPRNSRRDLPRFVDLPYDIEQVGTEADRIIGETPLWTVSAYNEPAGPHTRGDGSPYHPEGRGCGFLLSVDGVRIFWSGDTDVLEGHARLDVDVFLPPIGGTFTMDRIEAADLAVEMDPELVVPIHYNTFGALETDSQAFVEDVESGGVSVVLDEGSTDTR
jgi:L-ascorbate metabolism protein UlaG (beta-lactamase superfamily)